MVQLNYYTIKINSGIILCINILVDYQGDSCDNDDSEGNESLIQELKLDADPTPGTESEETDKVISLQYSYNNLTFK